jgi:hypothetical protein
MRVCLGGGYKQKKTKSAKNAMPEVSIHPRLNFLLPPLDSQCLRIYLQHALTIQATGNRIEGLRHGYVSLLQVIIIVPMFLDAAHPVPGAAVLALGAAVLALDVVLLDTAVVVLLDIAVAVLAPGAAPLDIAVAVPVLDAALLDTAVAHPVLDVAPDVALVAALLP